MNKVLNIKTFIPSLFILGFVFIAFSPGENIPIPYQFPKLTYFPDMPQADDNPVTVDGVKLGRYLFYDPILSYDSSFSCSSCHLQEYAFSDAPNVFSKGINGDFMERNTPGLFNLAWYSAMHWDGKHRSIEEQVFHPIMADDEMDFSWVEAEKRLQRSNTYPELFNKAFGEIKIDSVLIVKAIAQFERTLISSNSKFDKVIRGEAYFTEQEYEGFVLMNDQTKGDCLHCHTTDANALGTTGKYSNNGIENASSAEDYPDQGLGSISGKESDIGLFKIPSLRNVALTAPYMHDGRFSTLEEVVDFYSDHVEESYNIDSKMGFARRGGAHLSSDEKEAIVAFLNTLTDYEFIQNPAFGNPFEN